MSEPDHPTVEIDIVYELRQTAGNLINGVIEDGEVPVSLLCQAADEIEGYRASSINWKRMFFDMVRQRNEAQGKTPIRVDEQLETARS